MKSGGTYIVVFAAALFVVASGNAAGQASEPDRRYLNEVFDGYERTADIVYAERYNDTTDTREKLTLRVFEPKDDTAAERALFILTPGGGFVQHEDHWMDDWGAQMARAGYVVAINRYRLSDAVTPMDKYLNALSKAFADQKAVIRYFVEDARNANRFKVDTDNIFIGGHSAGAITSLHVAYLDAGDDIDKAMAKAMEAHGVDAPIRGVVNLSGAVTDLDIFDKDGPPLLSIHGDRDGIVPIATADNGLHGSVPIHRRADEVGLDNTLYVIRGARHNDPAESALCPECIPLTRRFMFNSLQRQTEQP